VFNLNERMIFKGLRGKASAGNEIDREVVKFGWTNR
jgi:hypothetical protein